jgi:hypothetical protein
MDHSGKTMSDAEYGSAVLGSFASAVVGSRRRRQPGNIRRKKGIALLI